MRKAICIAGIACTAFLGSANAADPSWQEKVNGIDSHARMILPGVMISEDGNSTRLYANGINGMRFMQGYYRDLLKSVTNQTSRKSIERHLNTISQALDQVDQSSLSKKGEPSNPPPRASESSNFCGASYNISATANSGGFWYVNATADASFQPHDPLLGPRPPNLTAYVFTFAKTTSDFGTMTDSDNASGQTIGYDEVAADTAWASAGPSAGCMTAEASASIFVPNCVNEYSAVSETYEQFCD